VRIRGIATGLVVIATVGAVVAIAAPPASAAISTVKSPLGAGYVSQPGDGFVSASTTFVMPAVTCASALDVEDLSLGVIAHDSEGAETAYAVGAAQCDHGTLGYLLVAVTPDQQTSLTASAGDKIVATLTETATTTRATVRDVTKHISTSASTGALGDPAVLVGQRGSAKQPTWGTVAMRTCQVNGLSLAQATPLTREILKTAKTVQTGTGLLANADSDFFKLTFKASS